MARARNIKPGIMENEDLAELSHTHRLLFIYLWMLADREGRLEDRPKRIKIQAFPYDEGLDVDQMLSDLQRGGFLVRYVADDKPIIQIVKFAKHQTPHVREQASILPEQAPESYASEPSPVKDLPRNDLGSDNQSPRSPDSLILISSDSLIADSLIPDCLEELADTDKSAPVAETLPAVIEAKPIKQAKAEETDHQRACRTTWEAYGEAYRARYGIDPVRNAKVNSQIKQLVLRLGGTESPDVAAYFVSINDAYYIRRAHELGILISNAEGIRTQWATGRQMNGTTARQLEQTQANINAAQEAAARIRARENGGVRNDNPFLR